MPDKPFLASVTDSAAAIEGMRQQQDALMQEISERQHKVDELVKQIAALNGLRQAYGYPPA